MCLVTYTILVGGPCISDNDSCSKSGTFWIEWASEWAREQVILLVVSPKIRHGNSYKGEFLNLAKRVSDDFRLLMVLLLELHRRYRKAVHGSQRRTLLILYCLQYLQNYNICIWYWLELFELCYADLKTIAVVKKAVDIQHGIKYITVNQLVGSVYFENLNMDN